MREGDWAGTALGAMRDWPAALRVAVQMMLQDPQPACIWWGDRHRLLYNDAMAALLGDRHPAALGLSGEQAWPAFWQGLTAQLDAVRSGSAGCEAGVVLTVTRAGRHREQHYLCTLLPVAEVEGPVLGVSCSCREVTQAVNDRHRLELLKHLDECLLAVDADLDAALRVLTDHQQLVPFALVYRQEGTSGMRLVASAGMQDHPAAAPAGLTPGDGRLWPCEKVLAGGQPLVLEDLPQRCGRLCMGPWGEAVDRACLVPIAEGAVLVYGISPRLDLDHHHQDFLQVLAHHLRPVLSAGPAQTRPPPGPAQAPDDRLAVILEQLPVGVWITDAAGAIVQTNQQADRIWGGPAPHTAGEEDYGAYPCWWPDGGDRLRNEDYPLSQVHATGRPVHGMELDIRRFNGAAGSIVVSASPIHDQAGRYAGAVGVGLDITETKRLLREVDRQRRFLQTIFDTIPVMLTVYDPEMEECRVNAAFERLTGWTDGDVAGRPIMELAYPDAGYRADVQSYMDALTPGFRDLRMTCKDGSGIDTSWANVAIPGDQRRIGIGLDISQRKEAERQGEQLLEENRSQRLFLETLLDSVRAGIAVMEGEELRFTLVNRAYQALRPDLPMVGHTLREVFPSAVTADMEALVQEVIATGQTRESIGYDVPVPGKPDAAWDHQIVRLPAQAGRPPAALFIVWDSTEHKRLVRRLRTQEEHFRNLADNISQLAWMADESGWIFWYNKRWFDYTGTTMEQVQGWGWTALQHPDHVAGVVERLQRSWDTGEPWEDLFPLRSAGGDYRWFLSRALPIHDEAGNVVRWFGTNTDITRQLRAEQDLERRSAELTAANRELQSFSYSVSHDLRAPLRVVSGFADLLLETNGERLDADGQDYLQQIVDGAARMNILIDDMLGLARVSQQEMDIGNVDLSGMAEAIVADLRAAQPGRAVVVDIQPDLRLRGDQRLLQIALGNLLGNAWKYTARQALARIV
ncbi:MAG: PAS domain-containing protein, partial [Planctomycetota bacterium]